MHYTRQPTVSIFRLLFKNPQWKTIDVDGIVQLNTGSFNLTCSMTIKTL